MSKRAASFAFRPASLNLPSMATDHAVEVINFGDELLVGIRENTHLQFIGDQLARKGLPITRNRVIVDRPDEIRRAFESAWEHSDVVITTGGLGPTADDVTRETIAEVLGVELVFDATVEANIRHYFETLGRAMGERHQRQCYVFRGATVLPNKAGTAPGMIYHGDGKTLVVLPGPRNELLPMFEKQVVPSLQTCGLLRDEEGYLQIRTCGIGESGVEELMRPIADAHPDLAIAYCVHLGVVDVRLSFRDASRSHDELMAIGREAHELLGDAFVCFGDCSLAQVVFNELRALGRTMAIAESCTGGLLCDAFTNIAGVSKVFAGGIVCYTNDSKVTLLEVPEAILKQHGAVSSECAVAMATGAAERLSADYGLSITGFAGPGGGNEQNPVGTIHIGYHSPVGVWSKTLRYVGGRLDVKGRAVNAALDWMRRNLQKYKFEEFLCDGGEE